MDLRDNTLVFFLSDHGGPIPMDWNPNYANGSSNAHHFVAAKQTCTKGDLRVPFVVSWPTQTASWIPEFESPVISIDIARTSVEIAGANPASSSELEGVNLIPYPDR